MSQTIDWGPLAQPVHSSIEDVGLPWRDNAWLMVAAPASGVFGTVHVSTSPNAEARRAQCNFTIEGRRIRIVERLEPGTFRSESINYGLDGVIEVQHPELRMQLRTRPRFVVGDYTASKVFVPLDERRPLQHFQQGVDIEGKVETATSHIDLHGTGFRDRTWGYRDEAAHLTEYAAVIACFEDFDLTVMKFASPTGMRTQGFVLSHDVVDVTSMALSRNTFAFFDAAELQAGERTIKLTGRSFDTDVWLATGETGFGPSLEIYDEFLELTTAEGGTGFGVLEQGILHVVC